MGNRVQAPGYPANQTPLYGQNYNQTPQPQPPSYGQNQQQPSY